MELTENRNIEKYAKQWTHCLRNTLLSYEYEWTCFQVTILLWNEKMNFANINGKKIIVNRLKIAQKDSIWVCIDVYRICERYDNDKLCEGLSTMKHRKLKNKKDLLENTEIRMKNLSKIIFLNQKKVFTKLGLIAQIY